MNFEVESISSDTQGTYQIKYRLEENCNGSLNESCEWIENYLQNRNQPNTDNDDLTEIQAYCEQPTVANRVTP